MGRLGTRSHGWTRAATWLAASAVLITAACSSGDDDTDASDTRDAPTPSEWERIDPAAAGFDPAALDEAIARAEQAASTCVAVVKDGKLVAEVGSDGGQHESFSVTKSLTSLLIGIAADDGLLDVDDPVVDHLYQWVGSDSADVTVRDLLAMVSGLESNPEVEYTRFIEATPDKTEFALDVAQEAPPGTRWAYSNIAVQVLSAVLESATGRDPAEFADEEVFDVLGMGDSTLTRDIAGNALTFSGLQTTCLDLARLGQLVLQGGVWDGEQVVSSAYLEEATQPSTELNAAYGWLWWLNRPGPLQSPSAATAQASGADGLEGQALPGYPEDLIWALGAQEQIILISPGDQLVAVRLGDRPPQTSDFGIGPFTIGLLDALREG